MHQLVTFELGIVQEALATGGYLAYVHPLTMCHLVLSVGSYLVQSERYGLKFLTLVKEDFTAFVLAAGVLLRQGLQVKFCVSHWLVHF